MFTELSVLVGCRSLMSIFLYFSFVGISCSENAFHPERFLSHLCTSSELQSKDFKTLFVKGVILMCHCLEVIHLNNTFPTHFPSRYGINAKTMSF